MQPSRLYVERGKNGIPPEIILGQTPFGETVKIRQTDIYKHILFRGQSGSGKSRSLALFLMEILGRGDRVIFIDPLGEVFNLMLYWYSYLYREYYLKGEQYMNWFTEQVLQNILFLDLTPQDHPFRHNMIRPCEGENISHVISRQIRFFDALLSISGGDGMDIQLQRRSNYVALISIFAATNTPLKEGKNFIYNKEFRERLLSQAEQRSPLEEVREAVAHFRYLENEFKGKVSEKWNSLETALSPFFENPCVRNFLLTSENNVDFPKILNHQSLFIKTPICDIPVRKLLFNYLYTVFFDLSDKRTTEDHVFFGSDESALVFNNMMADYICRIRNHRVYLINSHQSLSQMLTEEGMKIAKTIEAQSRIKIFFRHDYEESKEVVQEIFSPQGKKTKLIEVTTTVSKNTTESSSSSVSESESQENSEGIGRNTGGQQSQSSTQSYSLTDAESISETLSKAWAEAESNSETYSISFGDSFTYSESLSRGISQLRGGGITFTIGEGNSSMTIETESGAVTTSEGRGTTDTTTDGKSESTSIGTTENYAYSSGQGSSTSQNSHYSAGGSKGNSLMVFDAGSSSDLNANTSQNHNVSRSYGTSRSQAISTFKSISKSMSQMSSEARTQGTSRGNTTGISQEKAIGLSRQFSEGLNHARQYAKGVQESQGNSTSWGKTIGHTHSITESTGLSISRAIQQAESIASGIAKSFGQNITQSRSDGKTYSSQKAISLGIGASLSISWKLVFYTIEEEKELLTQEVRGLQPKCFYLSFDGQEPVKVISEGCFFLPTQYGEKDFFEIVSNHYKKLPHSQTKSLPTSQKAVEDTEPKIYLSFPENEFAHFFQARQRISQ